MSRESHIAGSCGCTERSICAEHRALEDWLKYAGRYCDCGEPEPCFVHRADEHHAMKTRLGAPCECARCRT